MRSGRESPDAPRSRCGRGAAGGRPATVRVPTGDAEQLSLNRRPAPPAGVLRAFVVGAEPLALAGGQGRSWVAGDIVLKPVEDVEEAEWVAAVTDGLHEDGFRVASPLRSRGGGWVVDGWAAWRRVEGEHEPGRWGEIVRAGEAFHRAVSQVPEPPFIARRRNPWSWGDRVAWGESPARRFARARHLGRLLGALRPVALPRQVMHGDLPGNVLFAPGLAPAVIDFAPYFRPAGFASAIVVGDALTWYGADESILEDVSRIEELPQLLLRALVYRIVTDAIARDFPQRPQADDPYLAPVELALALATGRRP